MAELIQIARGVSAIRFILDKPHMKIGRGNNNDICLSDAFVSKEHAIIETRPSDKHPGIYEFFIRDLGSTNHSFVNKTKIKYQRLHNNDTVHIGHNEFRFVCAEKEIAAKLRESQEETKKMPDTQGAEPKKSSDSGFSRRLNILN